jgi:hypothetical protein
MQKFKTINKRNESVKIEIEGVGTVRQIELAEKLYFLGKISYKCKEKSQRIALTNAILNMAINELNLYPKEF